MQKNSGKMTDPWKDFVKGVVANNGLALEFVSGGWLGLIFDGSLGGRADEVANIIYFDRLMTRYSIQTNRRQRERERDLELLHCKCASNRFLSSIVFSCAWGVACSYAVISCCTELLVSFCFTFWLRHEAYPMTRMFAWKLSVTEVKLWSIARHRCVSWIVSSFR